MLLAIPEPGAPYNAGADLLERAAARGSDRMLRCQGRDTSGADLSQLALSLQAALEARGLRAGDRVLLLLRDTPAFYAGFLGAMRGGMIPIPISTALLPIDVAFIAADAAAAAVLLDGARASELARADLYPAGATVLLSDGWGFEASGAGPEPAVASSRADDDAFFLYTSGTTGRPKGVVHRHLDLPATAEHFGSRWLGVRAGERLLSAPKLFFAYGLGNSLSFPIFLGAEVVLHPDRPTPESMFALIARERPSIFFAVPTLYASMLAAPAPPGGLGEVRLCVSAGEALAAPLLGRWQERFGVDIVDGLGSTEMLHMFLSNRPGQVRPDSSGMPVAGYRVRIVDEAGRDVKPGEVGALLAAGPSAARRYHARPEETGRTMLADGWLRTGDSYRQNADGTFTHVGRTDDLMKVSGQYVSPVEVEAALLEHPAVLEAAVVAAVDANGLTTPRAIVVPAPGVQASDALAREVQAHARSRLAPHKYPRQVEWTESLPRTATGKVRRFALREAGGVDPRRSESWRGDNPRK